MTIVWISRVFSRTSLPLLRSNVVISQRTEKIQKCSSITMKARLFRTRTTGMRWEKNYDSSLKVILLPERGLVCCCMGIPIYHSSKLIGPPMLSAQTNIQEQIWIKYKIGISNSTSCNNCFLKFPYMSRGKYLAVLSTSPRHSPSADHYMLP